MSTQPEALQQALEAKTRISVSLLIQQLTTTEGCLTTTEKEKP